MRCEDTEALRKMLAAAQRAFALHLEPGGETAAIALLGAIEEVGEASLQVSDETKKRYADLPWDEIVPMRYRMLRGGMKLDHGRDLDRFSQGLPRLISRLREILGEAAPDAGEVIDSVAARTQTAQARPKRQRETTRLRWGWLGIALLMLLCLAVLRLLLRTR